MERARAIIMSVVNALYVIIRINIFWTLKCFGSNDFFDVTIWFLIEKLVAAYLEDDNVRVCVRVVPNLPEFGDTSSV